MSSPPQTCGPLPWAQPRRRLSTVDRVAQPIHPPPAMPPMAPADTTSSIRASLQHRMTAMRRWLGAGSTREGALDLVQMLTAVVGTPQRLRAQRQNGLDNRRWQRRCLMIHRLSRGDHRVLDLSRGDGPPPGTIAWLIPSTMSRMGGIWTSPVRSHSSNFAKDSPSQKARWMRPTPTVQSWLRGRARSASVSLADNGLQACPLCRVLRHIRSIHPGSP